MGKTTNFNSESTDLDDPATSAVAITPDNGTDLVQTSRYIMVAGAGTMSVDMHGLGTNVQLTLAQDVMYPIRVKRIYVTGTAATGIIAFY